MLHKCKYFTIRELVPPHVFNERGEKAWGLLDSNALHMLDALRTHLGPITVNNWHIGGSFKESGLRTPKGRYYRPYSQHSFGRAFDCKFKNVSAEDAQAFVISNPDLFPYITRLEDAAITKTWLHFDTCNFGDQVNDIYVFKP